MAEKDVIFPGQMQQRPKAHIPGQPMQRGADGRPVAVAPALGAPYGGTDVYQALARDAVPVAVQLLTQGAVAPALSTDLAAGYDLVTPEAVTLKPGERTTIPLGIAMALPSHLHGRIESRSGLALKGMVVLTGVIDADYRGEVKVIMQNFSDKAHEFAAGDRVAQLVLRHTVHSPWITVDALPATARGAGGFGSTGS